jgi:hypothetical protein
MKPKFIIVAAICLFASALCYAAYTKQNARVVRVQFESAYNGGTQPVAVRADAFLVVRLVNDTDSTDVVFERDWKQVSFDLLDPDLASVEITASGKTVTYPQLAALIRKAALDRANAAGIQ